MTLPGGTVSLSGMLLLDHAIMPLKRRDSIDYKPSPWLERGREGSIKEPAEADVVTIEGVGLVTKRLASFFDWIIWVQSDYQEAHRRGIIRDLGERPVIQAAERFWNEWQASEVDLLPYVETGNVQSRLCCELPQIVRTFGFQFNK